VAIVIVVEVVVRQLPVSALIPYRSGETEYAGVAALLDAFGPAEISFVGSSRTHEGVVPEELMRLIREDSGRSETVANYACSGATAFENEIMIERVVRDDRPKLVLYGLSPHQLYERREPREQVAMFMDFGAWRRYRVENPDDAGRLLPAVVRNEIGQWYWTLKYRNRAGVLATDFLEWFLSRKGRPIPVDDLLYGRVFPCPARGERSRRHVTQPNVSLVNRPLSKVRLRKLREPVQAELYPTHGGQLEHVGKAISACNAAGVELVLFELPLSSILQDQYRSIYGELVSAVREQAEAEGVRFVRLSELGVAFTDADFREHSHLNYNGAIRLTRGLYEAVIRPALEGLDGGADAGKDAVAPASR
jgi:hypothetical protein